jgi:hypothetical protein
MKLLCTPLMMVAMAQHIIFMAFYFGIYYEIIAVI